MNILFSLSLYFIMIIKNYEILQVSELKALLNRESKDVFDFDRQLDHSNAFVYYLQSGRVILMPNSLSNKAKGLIFRDKQVFDKYASIDSFPIENENISIEEKFQHEILQVGSNNREIMSYLSNLYGLDSSLTSMPQILLKAQGRIETIKVSNKETLYTNLLLGEYIRKSVKGKWILLKQYGTFNPYYIPAVINSENFIIVVLNVSDLYFNTGEISLENFILLPFIQEPSVKFGDSLFNHEYSGYKIVN